MRLTQFIIFFIHSYSSATPDYICAQASLVVFVVKFLAVLLRRSFLTWIVYLEMANVLNTEISLIDNSNSLNPSRWPYTHIEHKNTSPLSVNASSNRIAFMIAVARFFHLLVFFFIFSTLTSVSLLSVHYFTFSESNLNPQSQR